MGNKTLGSSAVELAEMDLHVVATLKHRQDGPEARSRSATAESADSNEAVVLAVQRSPVSQSPLRHAPDVSGIAITTVTEEKWSSA